MRFPLRLPTLRRLAATLLVVLAATLPAFAQGPDMSEADQKALVNYKLTMERVDKINAVCKKLVEAAKTDPQIVKEMQTMGAEKGGTFDQMEEVLDRQAPHIVSVIKGEGMEARDFILGVISTVVADMSANLGVADAANLPAYVPLANVELAGKNRTKFDEAARSVNELNAIGKTAQ